MCGFMCRSIPMKKVFSSLVILTIFIAASHAQRSKVIAAFQLIENGKYEEAKTAIEEATHDQKTRGWTRTWYARGLLAQQAYEKGMKDNDKKKYELYPDQLYVAYDSYRKTLLFDRNGRMNDVVAPMYVQLANDFLKMGEKHYKDEDYGEALRAFEHALDINKSPILTIDLDTNLVYNAALSAYQANDWDKAMEYLTELNEYRYSSNIPHLLNNVYLQQGDSTNAEQVLAEGVERYAYEKDLVLLYVDQLYQEGEIKNAVSVLDSAAANDTVNAVFFYTKGLIYQKSEQYNKAIRAYERTVEADPEKIEAYSNIATCYYNMAVEIEEKARKITNMRLYRSEKVKSDAARKSAVMWLERAYEKDPLNQDVRDQLNQLNQFLRNE